MTTSIAKGIELLDERAGLGAAALKGDAVIYNARLFLRKGDEVTTDPLSIETYGLTDRVRVVDGVQLLDHRTILGKRQPIAAVEKTLYGMQAGGYREVLTASHLAYGSKGLPGRIPADAMLRIQLWVRDVASPDQE
ncbi:MAG: FKBP-type peptidyl-prolyl cis-trans isomerase [Gammaproteobacteria bacterium]|nr:FKBP-type peptidyl-prolyl cis-trans isomerase [Gammaproteobacteria bacterium]